MSGWDSWAANVLAATALPSGKGGAALYCPSSGALWGKAGDFACDGNLHLYDKKSDGGDVSGPKVQGATFMFIRKTQDDNPANVFKKGQASLVTMKGPSGSRVAIYIQEEKPEGPLSKALTYLGPHVN